LTFTSLDFAAFAILFFLLYWLVLGKKKSAQNVLIVCASYIFYGWWDWRFLFLIAFSSVVDYLIGLSLDGTLEEQKRKYLLYCSLFVNISLLGFFKYFNFFIDSFNDLFHLGSGEGFQTLDVILPVGISFYTFQTLSYSIDVYNRRIKAERNAVVFFAYVSFFPQLVAGPIERAGDMLPQLNKKKVFDYELAADGLRQILWGLFKKLVVANHCAQYVNQVRDDFDLYDSSSSLYFMIFGGIMFYADFSSYSDIAIGLGKQFGIRLSKNFDYPFFSRNFQEFWRKWHMTLIRWFRDYVFFRLKKKSKFHLYRNILIIFVLTGFWHGAGINFIVWGFLHGVIYLISAYVSKKRRKSDQKENLILLNRYLGFIDPIVVFSVFCLLGTFFYFDSIKETISFFSNIFCNSGLDYLPVGKTLVFGIFMMFLIEGLQRRQDHGLSFNKWNLNGFSRWIIYVFIGFLTFGYGVSGNQYLYFQF
jgi:alginate O-acetyltransferase complex protein AlgI